MSKHRKVTLNTDPSGIHYSSWGVDYEGCEECLESWPCEVSQLEDRVTALEKQIKGMVKKPVRSGASPYDLAGQARMRKECSR